MLNVPIPLLLFSLELLVETVSGDVVEWEQLFPTLRKLEQRLASESRVWNFRPVPDEAAEADLSLRRSSFSSSSHSERSDPNDEQTAGLLLRARYEPDITHPIYLQADTALPDTLRVVLSLTYFALRNLNRLAAILKTRPFGHLSKASPHHRWCGSHTGTKRKFYGSYWCFDSRRHRRLT